MSASIRDIVFLMTIFFLLLAGLIRLIHGRCSLQERIAAHRCSSSAATFTAATVRIGFQMSATIVIIIIVMLVNADSGHAIVSKDLTSLKLFVG